MQISESMLRCPLWAIRETFKEGLSCWLVLYLLSSISSNSDYIWQNMVFLFKRQHIYNVSKKVRFGYQCFGCQKHFKRRRDMANHQGPYWPFCTPAPKSTSF